MAEAKEKKAVTLRDIYDGYAAKAKKAGKDHEVDIVKMHKVEFIADFGEHIRKGHKQSVSTVMFDYYNANGVVKLAGKDEAEATEE